jgi:hypothetical protein
MTINPYSTYLTSNQVNAGMQQAFNPSLGGAGITAGQMWQAVTAPEPVFNSPREKVVYDMLMRGLGSRYDNLARQICAMLDAMHIQEAFDLEHRFIVVPASAP